MARRKLKLNDGKTEIIVIRGNLRFVSVVNFGVMSFGDTQLVPCESAKNLGVVLDFSLSFRSHIDSIVKTCNFHICNLYMIKDFVNRKNLVTLRTGKVVSKWKLANVTPLFKKGDKSNPGNYQPISLTSVVCKLMESILRDKIVEFLEKNNIIRDSQHSFRNRRSCLTNLLDFLHDIYEMYEEGRAVDIIYLDFQKAFDKVPHRKLLNKVESHGISGHIHRWISDWLCDRKQRVVLNEKFSDWRNVSSGVPQGSVLGPILFLIYINDLDEDVKCKISKFADDTKIANRVISLSQQQELQNDLNTLGEWAVNSQMFFNVDKCKVLHIGNRNVQANYTMNGKHLAKVEQEKDLGVVISSDLKPSKQCSEVVKTANKLIGFIGRSFEFRTEEIILNLYNALVRPHLEYCVQCWSPYYKKDSEIRGSSTKNDKAYSQTAEQTI